MQDHSAGSPTFSSFFFPHTAMISVFPPRSQVHHFLLFDQVNQILHSAYFFGLFFFFVVRGLHKNQVYLAILFGCNKDNGRDHASSFWGFVNCFALTQTPHHILVFCSFFHSLEFAYSTDSSPPPTFCSRFDPMTFAFSSFLVSPSQAVLLLFAFKITPRHIALIQFSFFGFCPKRRLIPAARSPPSRVFPFSPDSFYTQCFYRDHAWSRFLDSPPPHPTTLSWTFSSPRFSPFSSCNPFFLHIFFPVRVGGFCVDPLSVFHPRPHFTPYSARLPRCIALSGSHFWMFGSRDLYSFQVICSPPRFFWVPL